MFLIRPLPFADESLSSWRQRSGIENGFRVFPRPPGIRTRTDVDLLPNMEELKWLSDELALSPESIRSLTLEAIGDGVHKVFAATSRRPWVLPCTTTRAVTAGGVCCPKCLSEDPIPYFRLIWRFAFLTHCPIHGCLMVERCQNCGSPVWPANMRSLLSKRPSSFGACQICGADFQILLGEGDECHRLSRALTKCATEKVIPRGVLQNATAPEFFGALWCLCQLFLRKSTHHLTHRIAVNGTAVLLPDGLESKLESSSIAARTYAISKAFWLLEEWPKNFIDGTKMANLCKYHFAATWKHQPSWLSETIENQLSKRTMGLTTEKVLVAVSVLENDGVQISKSSLRRVLGVRESKSIDNVVMHRRSGTIDEFVKLCQEYERQLVSTASARDQRVSLYRDYLILLLSTLAAKKLETICNVSNSELRALFATLNREAIRKSPEFKHYLQRAEELARNCRPSARAAAKAPKTTCNRAFIGRYGDKLVGHTVRARISRDMRKVLPLELWNSADVFRELFTKLSKGAEGDD